MERVELEVGFGGMGSSWGLGLGVKVLGLRFWVGVK